MFFCFSSCTLYFGTDVAEGQEDRLVAQCFRALRKGRSFSDLISSLLKLKKKKKKYILHQLPYRVS